MRSTDAAAAGTVYQTFLYATLIPDVLFMFMVRVLKQQHFGLNRSAGLDPDLFS
jgi:hypothetical protein